MASLAITPFAAMLSALSSRFAASAIAGLWESLLLALAVALALKLASNLSAPLSAQARFLLWTITFAVLALLPFVHSATTAAVHPVSSAVLTLSIGWSLAIAALWLGISTFRLGSMLREALRLRQIWRRAQPLPGEPAMHTVGSRHAQLCVSSDVDRPSVIGFLAPRILIPDWLLPRLTPQELDQIVIHELEHLRRRDDWSNLLQKLSLALFPLNPVLLWIESRLCLEREMACDEGVLARTALPHAYATCLTNLAEHSLRRRALSLSLGALAFKSQLGRRVASILRRSAAMRPWQQAALSTTLVFALLGGAATLARCPQLVAFTAAAQPSLTHNAAVQLPVSLAPTGTLGAHMVSLKAEMPSSPKPAAHLQHHAVFHRRPSPRQPGQANWLVLTSAGTPIHPQIVLTVIHTPYPPSSDPYNSPSFAIPTETGWLVLQL